VYAPGVAVPVVPDVVPESAEGTPGASGVAAWLVEHGFTV
jgi:hypothetical protein